MSGDPASMLLELATNPLDPGYAEAARRRGPASGRRWYDRPATALGCLLVGFTLVVAYQHTHRTAPEAATVHQRLVERVRAAQRTGDELQAQAQALADQVAAQRDAGLAGAGTLRDEVRRAEAQAGVRAVHGPGARVVIGDPPAPGPTQQSGRAGTIPIGAAHIITDRDVRAVVNELWADGAEAVAVNGLRLTPTSAIRFAGEAVLVDLRPVVSPYRIEAIGDANQLVTRFADSPIASRYQTLAGARGTAFSLDEAQALTLPAAAPVMTRYARATS